MIRDSIATLGRFPIIVFRDGYLQQKALIANKKKPAEAS